MQAVKDLVPLPTHAFRVGASAFVKQHKNALIGTGAALAAFAAVVIGWKYLPKTPTHPSHPPAAHAAIVASAPVTHSTPSHVASSSTPKPTATPSAYVQSQPYMKAGMDFYKAGDFKQAVDQFKDAEDADEKNAEAYWWLSRSYAKLDKDHKECKQLSAYLDVAPKGSHAKDAKAEMKKKDC